MKKLMNNNVNSSVITIGHEYYIAMPTYEWWPGVAIYRSSDMEKWQIHSYPLNRMSQLELKGVANGGGVWSPSLSYDGKKYYLVFTNVRETGIMKQMDNYLVTTDDLLGGIWSSPVYLNSLGTNPYMIHEEDKKWFVCTDEHFFNGKQRCVKQEYDVMEEILVGEPEEFEGIKGNVVKLRDFVETNTHYDFKHVGKLSRDFQTLRSPLYSAMTTFSQGLVVRGQDGLTSRFEQSLIARRIDAVNFHAETKMEFEPECEKHMAGLTIFYDTENWYYCCVTRNDETRKREVCEFTCDKGKIKHICSMPIEENVPITLGVSVRDNLIDFSYKANGSEGIIDTVIDSMLPYSEGAMVGICVQDMVLKQKEAIFEYFNYDRN